MMTNKELTRLKALAKAATPAPWEEACNKVYGNLDGPGSWELIATDTYSYDAEFIAAARTAVPALIEFVEKLKADNADLLAAHDAQDMTLTTLRCEIERLRAACPDAPPT